MLLAPRDLRIVRGEQAKKNNKMIGLDTNILVRYLVQDDPIQSRKVSELIEQHLTTSNPGFLSAIVLLETVWVLQSTYSFTSNEIAAALGQVLQADALLVEHAKQVFTAIMAVKEQRGSFADALIGAINVAAGCSRTFTFDRRALRLHGFEIL